MRTVERPGVRTVDQLLVEACHRHAEATALVEGTTTWTYAELLRGAEDVAAELRRQGFGPGDVVAVTGTRSVSAILATFGTWLARAVVVLVDDSQPPARRAAMLAGSGADVVVDCEPAGRWTVRPLAAEVGGFPRSQREPDHAYVAFTSGSTGTPKAIVGSHRGLADFLSWQASEFQVGPEDRFAHLTTISFDVWFRDALTPLVSGAQLHLPPASHFDAQGLVEFVRAHAITGLHIVPSVAKVWVAAGKGIPAINALRVSFFAGEPLDAALVEEWRTIFPATDVINLYGPTETTLAQHFHVIENDPSPGIQRVGRNRPHSRTYVVDDDQRPVPAGVTGHVWIAAETPAHGYLVDGVLTPPFRALTTPDGEVTAYPTGDLGRMDDDGALEVLGRADDQVKIGGVRIELQEVRSVLQSHPDVRDAFVCLAEDARGKLIAAAVEGDPEREADLRSYLSDRLLGVMVPGAYLFTSLVRLPNGKVDRRAMTEATRAYVRERASAPPPTAGTPATPGDVAPRVRALWQSASGAPAEALSDSRRTFFDVGGTSLTLALLHVSLQQEFGVRFPIVKLFEHPTLAAQCDFVAGLLAPTAGRDSGARDAGTTRARRQVIDSRRGRARARQN